MFEHWRKYNQTILQELDVDDDDEEVNEHIQRGLAIKHIHGFSYEECL